MKSQKKVRVLIAKPGLDGHERGARVLSYGLRDEGFEVIYAGLRQTPEQIAAAAIQEDVDVVGLSILSGAHLAMTRRVIENLEGLGGKDILLLVGGVIPEEDIPTLKKMGVAGVFTSGATIKEISEFVHSRLS